MTPASPELIRLANFHAACGARIFTGYLEGESAPRYFASDRANAAELARCPACGGELVFRIDESIDSAGVIHRQCVFTVLTAHEMERRYLAARERLCAGAPLDAAAIVCMGAEMEEGRTLEEIAPLYGRTPAALRAEIEAFTAPAATNPEETTTLTIVTP